MLTNAIFLYLGKGKKATLYVRSPLMGNVVTLKVWLHEVGKKPYAQYPSVPYVRFTQKRKRSARAWYGSDQWGLVVEGWDAPEAAGVFNGGKRDTSGPLDAVQAKHSFFSNGWTDDFSSVINPLIESGSVKVVQDFREKKNV